MIEVIAVVLIAVVICALIVYLILRSSSPTPEELRGRISSAREKLSIAERKFMQGKIKKNVFSSIVDQIEEELLEAELSMYRLKKAPVIEVGAKVDKISAVLTNPTKFRRAKIGMILRETELLRSEMGLLEAKFLRREITQAVFEKLVMKKESALISKEKELTDVVVKATEGKEKFVLEGKVDEVKK